MKIKSHLRMWENYHAFGKYRAALIRQILSEEMDLRRARILDLGCGTGATARALTEIPLVVSADVDLSRLLAFNEPQRNVVRMTAQCLGLKSATFDGVILHDVLEHLVNPHAVLAEVRRVLKPGGVLYLTTPNRLSVINFVSDPHWNLPLVAIGSRKWVKFLVARIFRRETLVRTDFAALLSWFRLRQLLQQNRFQYRFVHRTVLGILFETPQAVVCAPLHLRIVGWVKKLSLQKWFEKIVPDRPGWFNTWLNPTWFILGKKID